MKRYLFLLDYDGTLTDFHKNPEDSRLTPTIRELLRRLRRNHQVIFVSGRFVKSLERVSGLKGFPMVGTHGFEGKNLPAGTELSSASQRRFFRREAARLYRELQKLKSEFPEIHLERKPFSATLHYRGIHYKPSQIREIHSKFKKVFKKTVTPKLWKLMEGKSMIEAMPQGFDKGKAVRKIVAGQTGFTPLFAGDDTTDIPALKALGKNGIRVGVGEKIPRSLLDFQFQNPSEFLVWLRQFA